MKRRLGQGLLRALGATLLVGCGQAPDFPRVTHCSPGGLHHSAPFFGADPEPVLLEVANNLSYRFEREPAHTMETLRGVALLPDMGEAIAVGDRGTVRVRRLPTGWESASSGTKEDLHAVMHAGKLTVAVGAHGVAAVSLASGGDFRIEDTGTTHDLLAVAQLNGTLAVGRGGVMVQRSKEGVWRTVDTRTTEDLAAVGMCLDHVCAVGAHGTIIDCLPHGEHLTCIPRPPLTDAALVAIIDYGDIYGRGVRLQRTNPPQGVWSPPAEWKVVEVPPWWLDVNNEVRAFSQDLAFLAVGSAGLVVMRPWANAGPYSRLKPRGVIRLPYGVDLNGAAFGFKDGYVVGEKGTIVHVGTEVFIEAKCRYW